MISNEESDSDLSAKPLPFGLLWGGPIVVMLSMNFVRPPIEWTTVILSTCLVWMGLGCAINARRCHRRHCYYASPVLLAGAALTLLVGFGIVDLGQDGLIYVTWGTFALVALTFLPEKLQGKYRN
jgi:hypothetical protein